MDANQSSSLKQEWEKSKRERFERTLTQAGWQVHQEFKKSTVYQKEATRIEVDWFGAFLFEFKAVVIPGTDGKAGNFIRTQGISDDRIDQLFSPGHDPNILSFKHLRDVGEIDKKIARLVRAGSVKINYLTTSHSPGTSR